MKETVLDIIKKNSVTYNVLLKETQFKNEDLDAIIKELIKERKIFLNSKNKYEQLKDCYIIGRLDKCSKNISYVLDKNARVTIPTEELHTALKYDLVVVDRTYENCGTIIGILERKNKKLVCEVKEKDNKLVLVPFNGNCEIRLSTPKFLTKDLIVGDRVYVELDNKIDENNTVVVNNVTKIGHFNDKMNDEIAIAISKDFDIDFSYEAIKELESMDTSIKDSDIEDRLDLRSESIFTIDSIQTKDMDDAVSIKKLYNGNYLLGVHIADVAHYIKPNTVLFKEALKRGTSVYLGDVVIPMLPSELSNGICSLNEGVDRLTKSCIMEITPKGKVKNFKIVDSIINSKKKMTYEELNDLFNGLEVDSSYLPFITDISLMRELSNILTSKKESLGNLEFESSDIKVKKDIYNDDKTIGFEKREQKEAEKIIENFMILANETVASYFYWRELPFIYRIHNNPDDIKIDKTMEIISKLGFRLVRLENAYGQKAIQNILNEFKDTPEYSIISNLLLRSMSKAKYSVENVGHFALALDNYCHFTSPIRRFPDLMVHNLIDRFINNSDIHHHLEKLKEELESIANHSSYKERQEDDAEKDYLKLKMAEYMAEHIGEEFTGYILDMDKNTVYIKLDNNIKGILDRNSSFGLSFEIDPTNKKLKCYYSKQKVTLGTKIIVKVSRVDIPQKEIYFDIQKLIKDEKDIKKLEKTPF